MRPLLPDCLANEIMPPRMAAARAVAAGAHKRHAALILTPAEKVRGKKRVKNPWTQFLADVSQAKKSDEVCKSVPTRPPAHAFSLGLRVRKSRNS